MSSQVDPTDCVTTTSDVPPWWTVSLASGYSITTRTISFTSTPTCALHFVLDLSELSFEPIGGRARLGSIVHAGGQLHLDAERRDDGYFLNIAGSRTQVSWNPSLAPIELIASIGLAGRRPRIKMADIEFEAADVDWNPPSSEVSLTFGMRDAVGGARYREVGYYFAP